MTTTEIDITEMTRSEALAAIEKLHSELSWARYEVEVLQERIAAAQSDLQYAPCDHADTYRSRGHGWLCDHCGAQIERTELEEKEDADERDHATDHADLHAAGMTNWDYIAAQSARFWRS